jgi:N-acetylglutamate synthase
MTAMFRDQRPAGRAAAGYRLEVRLSAADVGRRVVIRWRRPAGGGDEIADVLGVLEAAGAASFAVRNASGELVTIPRDRALAGKTKTVPAAPRRRQQRGKRRLNDPR